MILILINIHKLYLPPTIDFNFNSLLILSNTITEPSTHASTSIFPYLNLMLLYLLMDQLHMIVTYPIHIVLIYHLIVDIGSHL